MSDKTSAHSSAFGAYQGVLVPDPRLVAIDDDESTITQSTPLPGVPIAQNTTSMVLQGSGTQDADTEVDIYTIKAGMPRSDADGGTFLWKYTGDSDYRGHDLPNVLTSWESVLWDDATHEKQHPTLLTLPGGDVIMAYRDARTTPSNAYQVRTKVRSASAGTWGSAVTVYNHQADYSTGRDMYPCMCLLPSGRVLLFHWLELSSGDMQVRMHYSDDGGASWSVGSRYCLPAPIVYEVATVGADSANRSDFFRLRAAELNGAISLVASTRMSDTAATSTTDLINVFHQYASNDLGATFTEIATSTDVDTANGHCGRYHELVTVRGEIRMFYVGVTDGSSSSTIKLYEARLSSAYQSFKDVAATSALTTFNGDTLANLVILSTGGKQGYDIQDGELAVCVDDAGPIYVMCRDVSSGDTDECRIGRLEEDDTVGAFTQNKFYIANSSTTYPRHLMAVWQRGRAMVAHQWLANPGNEEDSLAVMYLGGYTTISMPLYAGSTTSAQRSGARRTWTPFDLPGDTIWTASGAGTESLTAGALNLQTTANAINYSINPAGSVAEGLIVRGSVTTTTSAVLSDAVILQLRIADGTNDYDIIVRFGTSSVRINDTNNSGNSIGTTTIDVTAGIDFLIAITGSTGANDGSIVSYFRLRDHNEDRVWTAGPTSTSLVNDTTTPQSNHLIKWGHGAVSTAESDWHMLCYTHDSDTGEQLTARTWPDDHNGRRHSPYAVAVADGYRLAAVDGPAFVADNWLAAVRYAHPVGRAMPWSRQLSPRVGWRTVAETQQTITINLDPSLTVAHNLGNVLYGVAFFGCNWRTGTVYGRATAGSYSSLGTINAADGLDNMLFVRNGNCIQPDTPSSSDEPYLFHDECAGWTIDLGSSKVRTISRSFEGKWNVDDDKTPTLILTGADNTEAVSGIAKLIPSDFAILLYVPTDKIRALRIVIDAQTTPDGYLQTGQIVAGPVVVHGTPPSWGRTLDVEHNTTVTTYRDGQTRTRVNGPPKRIMRYAWTDGVDSSKAMQDGTPDYVTMDTTGTPPGVATVDDIAQQVEGLMLALDGPDKGCVVLPEIAISTSDQMLNRRNQLMLARLIAQGVGIESVQGQENVDEVVRVAVLPFEEIT